MADVSSIAPLFVPTLKRAAEIEDLQSANAKKPKYDKTPIQTDSPTPDSSKSLSDTITPEKIAAIRAKRFANKRKTIKRDDDVCSPTPNLEASREATRLITNREFPWRTRESILQVPGRNFAKTAFAILQSVKAKEAKAAAALPKPTQPTYNRYKQEQQQETGGFNIDTTASYRGLSLQRVQSVAAAPQRVSRTPIVIIPAVMTSLINMFNVRDILEDLRFVDPEGKIQKGFKRDGEVLVQRQRDGRTVHYRIVDNTSRFRKDEWARVVAVCVQGPAWQFKGWPLGGPVAIFSKIKAFHFKWEETKLDANVAKWAVEVIELGRNKRHLHRAKIIGFWETLEKHMTKNKPHLRF